MTKTGTPQTDNNLPETQNNHKGHHDYNLSRAQDTPKGHNGHKLINGHNNIPITTATIGKTATAPNAYNLRPKTLTRARITTVIKTPTKKSLHRQPPQDPKQLHPSQHSKTVTTSLKKHLPQVETKAVHCKYAQRFLPQ